MQIHQCQHPCWPHVKRPTWWATDIMQLFGSDSMWEAGESNKKKGFFQQQMAHNDDSWQWLNRLCVWWHWSQHRQITDKHTLHLRRCGGISWLKWFELSKVIANYADNLARSIYTLFTNYCVWILNTWRGEICLYGSNHVSGLKLSTDTKPFSSSFISYVSCISIQCCRM